MIDLHMHSTYSDGTDNIKELIDNVAAAGIKTFAICDHDNFDGCKEVVAKHKELLKTANLNFYCGIEFSTFFSSRQLHILAYGFDVNNNTLNELVKRSVQLRKQRIDKRLELLEAEFGIVLNESEKVDLLKNPNAGKPHIAKILIKKGLAETIGQAIDKYMFHKLKEQKLTSQEVIKKINQAGAVAVWAHPLGGSGEKRLDPQTFAEILPVLVGAGLGGLECYYSIYNSDDREIILQQAKKYNLLVSGGSDYHGKNKSIKLGELGADLCLGAAKDTAQNTADKNVECITKQLTILNRINKHLV